MQMLLCAATEMEIAPTLSFLQTHRIPVRTLITGVGMLSASYAILNGIIQYQPDFVLQAGIAGCINPNLALTKVLLIEKETVGDLGVWEGETFLSAFDLKLQNKNSHPWKDGWLCNDLNGLKASGLSIVNGVTVNEISTHPGQINYYRNSMSASVETMEGAALHYVCLQQSVRFLQIRSLSNFVGERNKNHWVMEAAIASLNFELQRLLIKFIE